MSYCQKVVFQLQPSYSFSKRLSIPKQAGRDSEAYETCWAVAVVTPEEETSAVLWTKSVQKNKRETNSRVNRGGYSKSDKVMPTRFGSAVYSEVTVNGVKLTIYISHIIKEIHIDSI